MVDVIVLLKHNHTFTSSPLTQVHRGKVKDPVKLEELWRVKTVKRLQKNQRTELMVFWSD